MTTHKASSTVKEHLDSTPRSLDTVENLSCGGFRVVQPIKVTVEPVEDGYLVSDTVTLQYGIGTTKAEAKADYLRTLIDYLEILSEHREHLAEDIQQHLTFITSHLKPIR